MYESETWTIKKKRGKVYERFRDVVLEKDTENTCREKLRNEDVLKTIGEKGANDGA